MRKRIWALALAFILCLAPAVPAEGWASDAEQAFGAGQQPDVQTFGEVPQANVQPFDQNRQPSMQAFSSGAVYDADLVVGYLAAAGASLNPFLCSEWDLVNLNKLVFEPLIELDENQKPTAMLAENWTHEGRTWTFTLRRGIQFHNGVELSAWDVKNTYDAFVATEGSNPYSDRIVRLIEDMEVTDDHTVTVHARYTGYLVLYAMTFPIVQSTTIQDDLARGTGPYWYVSYEPDSTARIESNPLWWRKQPEIGSITFRHYPDAGVALEGLQTGAVDTFSTRSSSAAIFRRLSNVTSLDFTANIYEMLVPNVSESSVMADLNVRKAVMYAIDRAMLTSSAYVDMAVQSEVPIQPGSWLYESQSARYYYSPERALQLLYDRGWSELTGDMVLEKQEGIHVQELTVNIITYNEGTNAIRENAARMIAAYLSAVGMKVNVEVISRDSVRSRLKEGRYDLALIGVNLSEIPHFYHMVISQGSLNYNNYADSVTDGLAKAMLSAETDVDMKNAYSAVQIRIVETLPFLGLVFRRGTVLSTHPLGGLGGIRDLYIYRGLENTPAAEG